MIVVTGHCRSGSSLVMQTLKHIGLDIAGHEYHDDFPVRAGNPKGYYDLSFQEVFLGIGAEYANKAVKLFGRRLPKIEHPSMVSHGIVCVREDYKAQDISTKKVIELELEVEGDSEVRTLVLDRMKDLSMSDIAGYRRKTYKAAYTYLSDNNIPYLKVKFEDMLGNPEETIKNIVKFLGVTCNKRKLAAALENVGYDNISI